MGGVPQDRSLGKLVKTTLNYNEVVSSRRKGTKRSKLGEKKKRHEKKKRRACMLSKIFSCKS